MLRSILIASLLALGLAGCTSTKIVGTYTSPNLDKSYKSVFVVGMVGDQMTDKNVAADLVDKFNARGINAQAIQGTLTPDIELTDAKKKEIAQALMSKGFDSILTFALISIDEQENYVPGTYSTAGYYPATMHPYYGSYWGYYGYYSTQVYSPGYYTTNKVYTMEAALYDLSTEQLVWSARSETVDPTSVNSFSREYSEVVAYNMFKARVVVKP